MSVIVSDSAKTRERYERSFVLSPGFTDNCRTCEISEKIDTESEGNWQLQWQSDHALAFQAQAVPGRHLARPL